jgi:hypothetical protein
MRQLSSVFHQQPLHSPQANLFLCCTLELTSDSRHHEIQILTSYHSQKTTALSLTANSPKLPCIRGSIQNIPDWCCKNHKTHHKAYRPRSSSLRM